MTEKQKKYAIIVGTIVIALILLLSSRKSAGNTIINNQEAAPIEVTIPSMNIPERSPFAINIPGLPAFTPYQYSAISPCMCNGASTSMAQSYQGPLVEFVTNQGGTGSNVYNYYPPKPVSTSSFTGTFVQR